MQHNSTDVTKRNQQVWVSRIDHRHGQNLSAHRSPAGAHAEVAEFARQWWGEAREFDDTLPLRAPVDDAEATAMYFAVHDEESYDIQCLTVGE